MCFSNQLSCLVPFFQGLFTLVVDTRHDNDQHLTQNGKENSLLSFLYLLNTRFKPNDMIYL